MSWEIRGSRLRFTLEGEHTLEELEQAAAEILDSPLFRPGMTVLVDTRLATSNPSAEAIRDRAARCAPLVARAAFSSQCAIVTGSDPHRYGLNRALAAVGEHAGFKMQVFHEMDEALEWLATPLNPD